MFSTSSLGSFLWKNRFFYVHGKTSCDTVALSNHCNYNGHPPWLGLYHNTLQTSGRALRLHENVIMSCTVMWGLSAGIRSLHNKVRRPEVETIYPKTVCGCPCGGYGADDRADRRAGKATITSGLLLERSEVLRSLRHQLRARSQGHHTIDRLEERGVERGSCRQSSLK